MDGHDSKRGPRTFFVPEYGALALYLMGLASLLVVLMYVEVRTYLFSQFLDSSDVRRWIAVIGFFLGLAVTLSRAIFRGPISSDFRCIVLFFAIIANGAAGLAGSIHALGEGSMGLWVVIPIWNLICAAMLLLLYRIDVIDERAILSDEATGGELLWGTIVLIIVFLVCRYAFDLHWAFTYSICVTYATSLSRYIGKFLELFSNDLSS